MRGPVERFARLTVSVLGASNAVVALTTSLPGREQRLEVAESQPPGAPEPPPRLVRQLRRVAREECLIAEDTGPAAVAADPEVNHPAFLGVPLQGERGELLGVLAAVDAAPRTWSAQDARDLEDLAGACAAELRLRASEARAHDARLGAERARHEAEEETGRAHVGARELESRLVRSELLLRAAEQLADTSGLDDVRRTVSELVSGDLKPAYVGLVLRERDGVLRRAVDAASTPTPLEREMPLYSVSDDWPSAQAARENLIVSVPDRRTLIQEYDPRTVAVFDAMGLCSAVCVPLPSSRRPTSGALVAAWDEPHAIGVHERAVLTAIAGYTALAVERALHLDERISVARQLQQAMLTDLPRVPGLELAALYRPADDQEMVGGDWYDAYPLPGATADEVRGPLAITIGDVTGHNTRAATLMGQARSMLRQADVERADSPASALASIERANDLLGTGISGTLVHAHLIPRPGGRWLLRWTNAGHPLPLLAHPHHGTEQLSQHSWLLYPGLVPNRERPVHERVLEPGAVLLLYTDGLVEHRGRDSDVLVKEAAGHLTRAVAEHTPLPRLLDVLADSLGGRERADDLALLAVRVDDIPEGA
ncbi:PP2C family protein-serine/threonine phosphatase [Streptomyces sp. NPDC101181]|uniref:PP2C family protein-serine/threonine phosphatase n=1 Tax=Streptomyces sp. NPDC101181 TaxID=3366125 RepID=UPI00381F24E8